MAGLKQNILIEMVKQRKEKHFGHSMTSESLERFYWKKK